MPHGDSEPQGGPVLQQAAALPGARRFGQPWPGDHSAGQVGGGVGGGDGAVSEFCLGAQGPVL